MAESISSVFFEKLYIEDVGAFENVSLVAENGRITGADVDGVDEFIKNLPDEGRVVCEFGLGTNPGVADACGYTLLDEKMADSFHIALGANSMFGGENQAEMHIDLVSGGKFSMETAK